MRPLLRRRRLYLEIGDRIRHRCGPHLLTEHVRKAGAQENHEHDYAHPDEPLLDVSSFEVDVLFAFQVIGKRRHRLEIPVRACVETRAELTRAGRARGRAARRSHARTARHAHPALSVEHVPIAAADALALEIPGVDEVVDDALGRSLGYTDRGRDLAQADIRIPLDGQQNLRVAREEVPRTALFFRT